MVVASEEEHKPFYKSWRTIVGTVDHKDIGLMYIVFSLFNLVIGGSFALMIRTELYNPGPNDLTSLPLFGSLLKALLSGRNEASFYTQLFTMHGTIMIFLVIFPLGVGFGNYLVPLLIGAPDMYWPRWNNAGFWLLIPGAMFIYLGMPWQGWYAYAPLSISNPGFAPYQVDFWAIGLLILGTSSVAGAMNFIMTIFAMRKPGLSMWHLDLFVWSMLIVSFIQIMATPIITTALISVVLDRMFGTHIFSASDVGGGPILFQHVFWAYSHPAVYIMLLPAMGLTSMLISKFSRRPIFGYKSMVWSQIAITVLGFTVWGHHIYAAGEGNTIHSYFFVATALIAIPSAIKMFNWVMTAHGANIKFEAPLLFMTGWLFGFGLGGITGIFLNIIPMDYFLQDTYWVVGHFHFVVIGGTVTTFFGALYYMFPHVFRRMYNRKIAVAHFIFWVVGYTMTFGSQLILGLEAMPRRYYAYPPIADWVTFNRIATLGAYSMGIAGILFAFNMLYYMFKGEKVKNLEDPFEIGEHGISPHPIDEAVA